MKDKVDTVFTFRVPIGGKSGKINLLQNQIPYRDSVSVISQIGKNEAHTIEWLKNNISFKELLFKNFYSNIYEIKCFSEIKEPFTQKNKKPGDIDLLLVNPIDPKNSVAIECKVINAKSYENQQAKVNKINKLKKGIIQVNKYLNFGFSQSYLMIIVLDDGRKYTNPNIMFRTTSYENLQELHKYSFDDLLSDEIGIIRVSINQITNNCIDTTNGITCRVEKRAKIFEQKPETTQKIEDLLKG